ncbi:MAG: hypothetical protein L0H59_19215, partial [Tomitella sp.]|nr:hypothetical protein [Tomitella sp.]
TVYEYVGTAAFTGDLADQDFNDPRSWREVRTPHGAQVRAYLENASVTAGGDLTLTATSRQTIGAVVVAASVAVGAGSVGLGGAGAGSSAENHISVDTRAFIDGDGGGITADRVTLTASDTSTIRADVGSAALAAAFAGSGAVTVAIGVALASNTISNSVEAYILDADVTATVDDITLTATEAASIVGVAVAASAAVSGSGAFALSIAGAGAHADNLVLTATRAFAERSQLTTTGADGDVVLSADDTSEIIATIVAVAASVAISGGISGAVAIGAAVARNRTGVDSGSEEDRNQVQAYLRDTSVAASGDLALTATAAQLIRAVVAAGSVAIAGGQYGLAIAGSGAESRNSIATLVQAFIDGDGDAGISADAVSLTARDTASISATTVGASVAASVAIGGAVAVAVALAHNDIDNRVEAFIQDTDDLNATAGGVTVTAVSRSQDLFSIDSPPSRDDLDDGDGLASLTDAFAAHDRTLGPDLDLVTMNPSSSTWLLLDRTTGTGYVLRWDADTGQLRV